MYEYRHGIAAGAVKAVGCLFPTTHTMGMAMVCHRSIFRARGLEAPHRARSAYTLLHPSRRQKSLFSIETPAGNPWFPLGISPSTNAGGSLSDRSWKTHTQIGRLGGFADPNVSCSGEVTFVVLKCGGNNIGRASLHSNQKRAVGWSGPLDHHDRHILKQEV